MLQTPNIQPKKIQLLVVEDEFIIAEDLKQRLVRLNYEVVSIADTGIGAVSEAEMLKPDLVLMDIRLRGQMDGVEAASLIRRSMDVPVIFLTGNSDLQTMQRAKETQPYGFIVKPFKDCELQAAIEIGLQRHLLETRLRESERRYRYLVEFSNDIIYQTDCRGNFSYFNPATRRLLGYSEDELRGRNYLEFVHPDFVPSVKEFYERQFMERTDRTYFEFPIRTKDQATLWLGQNTHLEYGDFREIVAFHSVARDITGFKDAEADLIETTASLWQKNESLHQLAATDELTGLYNRRGFMTFAEQQLKLTKRGGNKCLLIFVDLDGLKKINDTLGHDEGNDAIVQTGKLLRGCFRESDLIARLGGDEFVVLSNVVVEEDARTITTRLQAKLDDFNRSNGKAYRLSFSIGVTHFSSTIGKTLDDFIAEADQAMYQHKLSRRRARQL